MTLFSNFRDIMNFSVDWKMRRFVSGKILELVMIFFVSFSFCFYNLFLRKDTFINSSLNWNDYPSTSFAVMICFHNLSSELYEFFLNSYSIFVDNMLYFL